MGEQWTKDDTDELRKWDGYPDEREFLRRAADELKRLAKENAEQAAEIEGLKKDVMHNASRVVEEQMRAERAEAELAKKRALLKESIHLLIDVSYDGDFRTNNRFSKCTIDIDRFLDCSGGISLPKVRANIEREAEEQADE